MEKYDIRLQRIKYLKQITEYRAEGRNIVYTDETYIHSSHTVPRAWTDGNYARELKNPISKGKRFIIVHAGGQQGFVPNGLLIFKSGSKSGDYHDEMNHINFMKWVETQLLPNLPEKSVLVVDNASYHNVRVKKKITMASLKAEMITWLQDRNITFGGNWTKLELFEVIKSHQEKSKKQFHLDQVMEQHGHVVLRLPPYHPELNPI